MLKKFIGTSLEFAIGENNRDRYVNREKERHNDIVSRERQRFRVRQRDRKTARQIEIWTER